MIPQAAAIRGFDLGTENELNSLQVSSGEKAQESLSSLHLRLVRRAVKVICKSWRVAPVAGRLGEDGQDAVAAPGGVVCCVGSNSFNVHTGRV